MRACAASSAKATVAAGVGEVEDAVGLGEERAADRRLIAMPFGAEPGERAGILADLGRAGALEAPASVDARRLGDDADQRPPHPAGGADDDQSHVGHGGC